MHPFGRSGGGWRLPAAISPAILSDYANKPGTTPRFLDFTGLEMRGAHWAAYRDSVYWEHARGAMTGPKKEETDARSTQ